jgi:drug/metabolite transporter (DMT)-like permease
VSVQELEQGDGSPVVVMVPPRVSVVPYLALLFGLAGMGASAIFVKWANAPGIVTGFYRMAIAAAVVLLPFGFQVRRERPLAWRYIGIALVAGVFFAGDLALWNSAVMIGNAANATLFGNTSPVWVAEKGCPYQ